MAARQRHRPHSHHMSSGFHQGARQGIGAIAGAFMLCGVILGVGIFGLMVLLGALEFLLAAVRRSALRSKVGGASH